MVLCSKSEEDEEIHYKKCMEEYEKMRKFFYNLISKKLNLYSGVFEQSRFSHSSVNMTMTGQHISKLQENNCLTKGAFFHLVSQVCQRRGFFHEKMKYLNSKIKPRKENSSQNQRSKTGQSCLSQT